jgi:hypothetical protein
MSAKLQEMENVVSSGAKSGEGMDSSAKNSYVPGHGQIEDLGGPTPENYRPDDDSAKLKEPGLSKVSDVVTRGSKSAEGMSKAPAYATTGGTSVSRGGGDAMPKAPKYAEETEVDETEVVAEQEEETVEVNVDEDVAALFAGEELSEEFQEKAKTVFEAAVTAKVQEAKKVIEEQAAEVLAEEMAGLRTELTERVDAYLEYVSQEWLEENALQIEHGLKTEMTESFLQGMRSLFEDHYVSIPDDKYDVVENMVEKLDDMETKLNEQIEKNIQLNRRLGESTAEVILKQVSEGLADTQKEKLASLAEGVEFEGEVSYREKLATLRESYFPSEKTTESPETLSEGFNAGLDVTGRMADYIKFMGQAR